MLTTPLSEAVTPYTKSKDGSTPGAERVLNCFLKMLRDWIFVERWFYETLSYADAVDKLRKTEKSNYESLLDVCRAHAQLGSTSKIVNVIIGIIGVALTGTPSTGKQISILAGAESLEATIPCLSEIGSMRGNDAYADVALAARKLLLMESMPSLEDLKTKTLDAVKKLSSGSSITADDMTTDHLPIVDVLHPLLSAHPAKDEQLALLEVYSRYLYRTFTFKDVEKSTEHDLIKFTFSNSPPEGLFNNRESIICIADLKRIISSGSLTSLAEMSESGSDSNLQSLDKEDSIPPQTSRTGVTALLNKVDDISETSKFEAILSKFPQFGDTLAKGNAGPVNDLYFVVSNDAVTAAAAEESMGKRCQVILSECHSLLEKAQVRRVTFICNRENLDDVDENVSPAIFSYGHSQQFKEDSLIRHLEPNLAHNLDLPRISANFSLKALASPWTTDCHIHMYKVTPKQAALSKDPKASKAPRIYCRAISILREFSSSSFERTLVDALNAIDLHSLESKSDNHLFINFLGDVENTVLDPVEVERVVGNILQSHGERVSGLGIVEVETRLVCSLQKDSPSIALRLVASNPTGYVQVMNTYVEASNEAGNDKTFKLIGGTKGSLAGTGDSSWKGLPVSTPYMLTRPFDAQRKYALRASDTVYCYDLPALFEAAVEEHWVGLAAKGWSKAESQVNTSTIAAKRTSIIAAKRTSTIAAKRASIDLRGGQVGAAGQPGMVMYTTELVVEKKSSAPASGTWNMQDYLNGDLQLVEMNRGAGANDVGMVAWIMTLKTYEYPAGRQLVLIANDITHKAGSFGTREDVVFKLASEYAREKCIPRLYVAANSGARIGVAEGVRKSFQVAFKDPSKPENGFDFLYVTKDDYMRLGSARKEIIAEPFSWNGEEVYRITDIIGSEPDLGVENLKGSGLIAGETSVAYEEIFTMTIVLGRTVGIGAYLVRLGQRTIQKESDSPIILTGYQALNKLMGVDVYSTNDQLGGPGIMYPNGVSHMVEPDHLSAVKAAVQWLSYVPSARGSLLPITDVRGFDSIERSIDFTPAPGTPYDPRALLEGTENDDGTWLSGFFDKGSFTETLSGWAQTVIAGRARLGGIPMGVVITENRTAEAIRPADPADLKASEAVIQQAGCVWFPNSAYKTAQAIRDFRTEDLPLIVFANWRGFSGGQRDMFDEVLKYGSMIVDAFVSYEQPVFVFIPPFAEIRGGAWVVLDASINAAVMEMYATAGSSRGGVLEANGAASVKYRTKDLIKTMHRLDDTLKTLDAKLGGDLPSEEIVSIKKEISNRERSLLPVYEQISVQFCELHDTPGRMEAVGVIQKQVEWSQARSFFYWRLRRKLAEFDLRKKIVSASTVGHGVKSLKPLEASALIKNWYAAMGDNKVEAWDNDQAVLTWMADHNQDLEGKVEEYKKECIVQEVYQVMSSVGSGANTGGVGVVEGLSRALEEMTSDEQNNFKKILKDTLQL